jgi:hypothetical protein
MLVISLFTQQHSSIESVKHREYSYEMIKLDGAATVFLKPLYEFPELFALVGKLAEGKPLDETDEANLRELAGATGWSVEDVADDLRNGWGVLWVGLIGIGSCLRGTLARPWSWLIEMLGRRLISFGAL